MSHLPSARYIRDPKARGQAIERFLNDQARNRKRDHDQWVKGQKRKAKKRIRRARIAHASRRRNW